MMCMTMRQLRAYHKQIDRLEAQESLRRIEENAAPHMSADAQRDLQNRLARIVEARPERPRIIMNNEDLAAFTRGR